jgi:hypothetical protein
MTPDELLARRNELHAELLTYANTPKLDTEWFRDRVREMEWLNRQLARLGVIPKGAN